MPSVVHRADSTRSDRSDVSVRSEGSRGSAKKVSFSKAVRVKKYPRRVEANGDVGEPSPEKRFWFKVYRNRHHHKPEIPEDIDGHQIITYTSPVPARRLTPVPETKRPDSPVIRRNHVRNIVKKFNREALLRQTKSSSPPSSPPIIRPTAVITTSPPRTSTPAGSDHSSSRKSRNPVLNGVKVIFGIAPLKKRHDSPTRNSYSNNHSNVTTNGGPYSSIYLKDRKSPEVNNNIIFPSTQDKAIQVKTFRRSTAGSDSKVTSMSDSFPLYSKIDKSKKKRRSPSPDIYRRISRSPSPPIYASSPDIALSSSRVDSFRRSPSPVGGPPVRYLSDYDFRNAGSSSPTISRITSDTDYGSIRKVKTSSRSFGFNLGRTPKKEDPPPIADGDSDVSSVASEPTPDSRPGSVLRSLDSRRKEMSYENVSRVSEHDGPVTPVSPSLWVRDADQDYRKEMAQNDISMPTGGYVWSYSATLGRSDKKKEPRELSPPRSQTLDRRRTNKKKDPPNTSGVKIMVNGQEVSDVGSTTKKSVSSIASSRRGKSASSDQLYIRGGLAAAYQARQKAHVVNGRANSSHATSNGTSKLSSQRGPGSSAGSASSGNSEPARRRNTVIMYIPGISHRDRAAEPNSSITRSQSVLQKQKPSSNTKEVKQPKISQKSRSETDIRRSKSIPKNTKFPWMKVKAHATPVH